MPPDDNKTVELVLSIRREEEFTLRAKTELQLELKYDNQLDIVLTK